MGPLLGPIQYSWLFRSSYIKMIFLKSVVAYVGTTFRPPNDKNDKLPFIRRRGEVAHILIVRWIR